MAPGYAYAAPSPAPYDRSPVPIPTTRAPPTRKPTHNHSASVLRRAKTLTRPERGVAAPPLINPSASLLPASGLPRSATQARQQQQQQQQSWSAWSVFAHTVTFWAPPFLLSAVGGIKDRASRQAWREKFALCTIALLLGGSVGFLTVGLDRVLCSASSATLPQGFIDFNSSSGTLGIRGKQFDISHSNPVPKLPFYVLAKNASGQDITDLFFQPAATSFPHCAGQTYAAATLATCCDPASPSCTASSACAFGELDDATFKIAGIVNTGKTVGYDWDQVAPLKYYFVIDGSVLNMANYMAAHPTAVKNDPVDLAIRTILTSSSAAGGKDGTRLFYNRANLKKAIPCLVNRYYAGNIDKVTPGCFVSQLFLYFSLIIIMGLVLARFAMACVFSWYLSSRLVAPPRNLSRTVISPAVLPEGANLAVGNQHGTAPWAKGKRMTKLPPPPRSARSTTTTLVSTDSGPSPLITMGHIGAELFCVCLVTCYSEGEESIRGTLDSISATNYSDSRKLLFVIADGMITGAGEKRSTPDICVGLLDADPRFGNPLPLGYVAVGIGAKAENRAMVYAGHYTVAGRRTPMLVVVKCGTDAEAVTDKKPGNRGKRDSQLILMHFFSRVTYNDRMSPLDFDLFRKIQVLMGVTPDYFETCLMVDADTKVGKDSVKQLVNCMHHDNLIMGVCGETRIANKRQSWVTAIQVYEYFISHHLAKAFESVFGGVTCLPGCFSMYRLKVRKSTDDDWVPLLTKPEITREYSQSDVKTLHQKNLLLLGEDRFLTTILLRTFPNRKMMFCPQARCRTVAPDSFSVLLSQRRRWINSTIHNLMELVRVRNLCGTFCFSMQFVVFMDLIGTTVLPVALTLTYVLIVNMALNPPDTFVKAIPLILLVSVIGLPAVLILLTTRKIVYIFWMFIYLAALPIWNFVLPLYSFWHFDDFSWGETRRVAGEGKAKGHDHDGGPGGSETLIPMRRWEDWERSRLRKLRREEKRRNELERSYPGGYPGYDNGGAFLRPVPGRIDSQYESSDTYSMISSDDDQWGPQIGGYNENAAQYPPPPVGLFVPQEAIVSAPTLGKDEMEAMLEMGFDDRPSQDALPSPRSASSPYRTAPRFQLSDAPAPASRYDPYVPVTQQGSGGPGAMHSPSLGSQYGDGASSAVGREYRSHVKRRSGSTPHRADGYGPLGPLDPSEAEEPSSPFVGRRF